jgi:hypothetical protein
MDREQVSFEVDPRSVLGAVSQMNSAIDGFEQRGGKAAGGLRDSFSRVSDTMLKLVDKQHDANMRLVRSIEAQSAAYGKSGVDKLISQRDQYIKRLGDEAGAIDRVRAAYDKMIEAEKARGSGDFRQIGEQVKGLVENPAGALGGILEKIGPAGGLLAGAAAGITAIATAEYEAAKGAGEWGLQMKDLELRTGFTAQQASEFKFAARAVGQEAGIWERAMRGLTMAIEDDGTAGERARGRLRDFGVDLAAVKSGSADTASVLLQISEGLNSLPPGLERDNAGLDIFKKSAIELIPVMSELRDKLTEFRDRDLWAPSQEDIERNAKYMDTVADIQTRWEHAGIAIKGFLLEAGTLAKYVTDPLALLHGGGPQFSWDDPGLSALKAQMDAARAAVVGPLQSQIGADQSRFGMTEEGLRALSSEAEKAAGKTREAYFGLKDSTTAMPPDILKARDAWTAAEKALAGYKAQLKSVEEATKFAAEYPKAKEGFERESESLARSQAKSMERVLSASFGNAVEDFESAAGFEAEAGKLSQLLGKSLREGLDRTFKDALDDFEELTKSREQIGKALLGYQEELVRLQGGPELDTARQIYDLKMAAAKDGTEQAVLTIDYMRDQLKIQDEMAKKQSELLDRQREEIQKTSAGLFSTLFTKPAEFGRQLANTLREAVMKPVTEGLGAMTARTLQPLIYGADGSGGVAGAFKGLFGGGSGKNPAIAATDWNTQATIDNSGKLAALAALIAMAASGAPGGMGVTAPSWSRLGYGGSPSFGGGSSPTFDISSSPSSGLPGYNAIQYADAGGGSSFGGSFPGAGGGSRGGGGFGLPNLKSLGSGWFNHGSIYTSADGSTATTAAGIGGFGGNLAGGLTSQGAASLYTGVGLPLAMAGLTGSRRGTWAGIGESTLGGALTGAGIGTMILPGIGTAIGAGIGAAAGFAAGGLEKLLGVESPENEAKRLVKAIYKTDIDMQMARQIVQVANSKYGTHVSIAVRSPEVREMLGLYAAGTGQKFPASASTPHGGSLIESGGALYQGATYQYGNAYAYSSSLPVMGAGSGGYSSLPSPGGPTMVSLNINGTSAADLLEGRVANVVNPGYVQDQYSAALDSSNGRTSNSAAMLGVPNLIVS